MPRDYYHILGVSRTCTHQEVKRAYRRLARRYHPDVCNEPDAETRFKEISEAYAVLSDASKRDRYDRFGHDGLNGSAARPGSGDFFDLFNQVFGGGFTTGPGATAPARGADIEYQVAITLSDVVTGWASEIEVRRQTECERCGGSGSEPGYAPRTCPGCGGAGYRTVQQRTILGVMNTTATCAECGGRGVIITNPCEACGGDGVVEATNKVLVEVPPGIANGQGIRYPGQGHACAGGGMPGDLYVRVMVESDPRFERHDRELITRLDLSFAQAALGDVTLVPTVDGDEELAIRPGAQTGDTLRIPARGLPRLHGGPRGDLIVVLRVLTPTGLTDSQRDSLLAFADASGERIDPQPEAKGIYERIREVFTGEA